MVVAVMVVAVMVVAVMVAATAVVATAVVAVMVVAVMVAAVMVVAVMVAAVMVAAMAAVPAAWSSTLDRTASAATGRFIPTRAVLFESPTYSWAKTCLWTTVGPLARGSTPIGTTTMV